MALLTTRAALLPNNVLTIDSSLRTITIPERVCNLGVETDANVQRLRFSMPRYVETTDLAGFAVRINYQNAKGEGDVYVVDDVAVDTDTITFTWLVGPHALACKGKVKFIVCMKKVDEAGNVTQAYHTTVASLPVLEGLETCECVVEENPEVLEQILLRLDGLEKKPSGVTYLESPDADGNNLNLRDLETGPYVLAGYFRPFAGSSHSLGFSNAIVNVARKDAGSHIMVLSPLNGIINFLEILVDDTATGGHTYTRTNINLPELWDHAANTVKRIISNATDGYTNLRDLPSGVYILDGYFPMYDGAASRLAFGGTLANVAADDTGSHILTMATVNGKMDFITIEVDDTQESGFSTSRTTINLPKLEARVAELEYKPMDVLSVSNTIGTKELGTVVESATVSWNLNKDPVNQTLNGEAVAASARSSAVGPISETTKFTIKATDERGVADEASTWAYFYNGIYYGLLADGATLDSAAILSLNRKIQSGVGVTFTVNAGEGQRIAYALPARYKTPSFWSGGIEGGFRLAAENVAFVNGSGYQENYNVWLSDETELGNTTITVQ